MVREKIIENYVKGKDVLDIGSVGQTASYSLWNLYKDFGVKSITGIDIEEITNENKEIFKFSKPDIFRSVVAGNMESYCFDKEFDVIVAGDVIEHVENQGLFLSNISRHLKLDGYLILTTPNAKWPTVFIKPNPTHTLWHDKYTLDRILKMQNFETVYFSYYYGNKKNYNLIKKLLTIRQSMILVCKKQK